jgi:hypothetical protein
MERDSGERSILFIGFGATSCEEILMSTHDRPSYSRDSAQTAPEVGVSADEVTEPTMPWDHVRTGVASCLGTTASM